jgi:hypothetical protein
MKTISYTLEYDDPEPKQSNLLSEIIYLYLPYKCVVGLKIQLESGEALQQNVTVRQLYNDESTGDVELHCGTLVIKAHKAVLGLHSETLRVAFGNLGCIEGQTGVYKIAEQHMKPEILEDVVKWMYVHSIENPQDKMLDLLEAAEYLQIDGIKETCGRQLADRVSVKECLQMLDLAFKYNMKGLMRECNDFFVINRKEVLAKTENLVVVVSNIPSLVLDHLGITL